MDSFVAFLWRSRRLHDYVGRAFRAVFPAHHVRNAVREVEAAGAMPQHLESPSLTAAKRKIRGGSIADWMESDRGAHSLERALVLNSPLQRYLDLSFASGKAVCQTANTSSELPAAAREDSDDFAEASSKALKLNHRLASGDAGRRALEDMYRFLISGMRVGET